MMVQLLRWAIITLIARGPTLDVIILRQYSQYKYVYFYSAGIDFSRHNLTSTDARLTFNPHIKVNIKNANLTSVDIRL